MARVELPEGQWAEIKDPDDLTGEDEVKVRAAVKLTAAGGGAGDDGEKAEGFVATAAGTTLMEYAMLTRVITSWSLPASPTMGNIRQLKLSQLRPLKAAIRPHMEALREDPNSLSGP